jgi:short-subunit dehydrogenase
MHHHGAHVLAIARTQLDLDSLKTEIGAQVWPCDVSNTDDVIKVFTSFIIIYYA